MALHMQRGGSTLGRELRDVITINNGCSSAYILTVLTNTLPIILMVSFYELVIYPLLGNFIPTMLKRVGLGMIVGILATGSLATIDMLAYEHPYSDEMNTTETYYCYLVNGSSQIQFDLSSFFIALPIILLTLAETLVYIACELFSCSIETSLAS